MPFNDYDDLRAKIEEYLEQEDIAGQVPDFIRLFEARINRELRVREMMVHAPESDLVDSEELPAGFLEFEYVTISSPSPPYNLDYIPADRFFGLMAQMANGRPYIYTVSGTTFFAAPPPGAATPTYRKKWGYYQAIPALETASTNWLLTKAPDVYLYGSLLEAQPFLLDDERIGAWSTLYDRGRGSLLAADTRARYRPGGRMRPNQGAWVDSKTWRVP